VFVRFGLLPPGGSVRQVLLQGMVIGFATVLAWKYLLLGVMGFYLLTSYVHLGDTPFLEFVIGTGRNLLQPASTAALARLETRFCARGGPVAGLVWDEIRSGWPCGIVFKNSGINLRVVRS